MMGIGREFQRQARRGIVRHVSALFNDDASGDSPIVRSGRALFDRDSIIWEVHGDVTAMMVGGVSALLLQMLHPAVLAGVWDHSNFRTDMIGRLRRTARFVAVTTYGDRDEAMAAIARVRNIHSSVSGLLADGRPYQATDRQLLAWVHLTEAWCFLAAWQRYGNRTLSALEQDQYFSEFATIGLALGANPVPLDRTAAAHALSAAWPELVADDRTREIANLVLHHLPSNPLAIPMQRVTMQAALDLLPPWARRLHGFKASTPLARPIVHIGALSLAKTVRWAFNGRMR